MMVFSPGETYTHEEIYRTLKVGNAGGIRLCNDENGNIRRAVVFTSVPGARKRVENPYHDRVEGDVLVYTAAGREGNQALGGMNRRLLTQMQDMFPVYGFILIGSRRNKTLGPRRWKFLGFLCCLRHYKEIQIDTRGASRDVFMFEFRVLDALNEVVPEYDMELFAELMASQEQIPFSGDDERIPIRSSADLEPLMDSIEAERLRMRMLALSPERFEHLVKNVMSNSGFVDVHVTRQSQDGGIDVNGRAGHGMWPIRDLLIQVQAKRWRHTVGRKEVAELRGSLQPHARGALVTTSQFSKAAAGEASETGKQPIVLVDGFDFARIVVSAGISLP